MFLRRLPVDPLGTLLCAVGALALICLPFLVFKANRIVPGDPVDLAQVLAPAPLAAAALVLAAAGLCAVFAAGARLRLLAGLAGIVVIALVAAAGADVLTPAGNRVVRVAPGAGFWIALIAMALLATDAVTRMRPRPVVRVLALAVTVLVVLAVLAHGTFDQLSLMREYAAHADRFASELRRHLWLALGSLTAAVLVGLPVGVLCHRVPRLRSAVLSVLNLIQTIPAIALFSMLMAPLALLAAAVPLAARLGVRGIGAAPAAVALFLYALLPVVGNTVAGLRRVSPAAVEAARGMGMTAGQVLMSVELPLALPVILTGVRVALVQNIGLVTIAALIGGGGLGSFVFQGIGQTAIDLVLLGAIPIVALAFAAALLLDALIETLRRGAAP
ncbi:MAG: ABC transporter permease [Proteobacteria bacterium]|nr:ABC transporter permease [Pseudomonadota bacterium]